MGRGFLCARRGLVRSLASARVPPRCAPIWRPSDAAPGLRLYGPIYSPRPQQRGPSFPRPAIPELNNWPAVEQLAGPAPRSAPRSLSLAARRQLVEKKPDRRATPKQGGLLRADRTARWLVRRCVNERLLTVGALILFFSQSCELFVFHWSNKKYRSTVSWACFFGVALLLDLPLEDCLTAISLPHQGRNGPPRRPASEAASSRRR